MKSDLNDMFYWGMRSGIYANDPEELQSLWYDDKQKEAFAEIFTLYKTGLFKTPTLRVPGSKNEDMLEEEALLFDHNPAKKWYGSPEKTEKGGVQDDAMFSLAWGIYGGRQLTVFDFRERSSSVIFGEMFEERTVGAY